MHMTFNFGFLQTEWSAKAFRDSVEEFEGHLPANAWPNVVLNNHDQPRFVSRYGGDGLGEQRARLAAMLMLTLRATVFLYYGEEIGMRDGTVPLDRLRDPVGIRFPDSGEGRDPERTPMQWNGQPGAGFTTVGPWLPIAADYPAVNVEAEQADATSLLSLYRDLISLRHACGALEYGAYRPVDGAPEDVYAYAREAEEETVLVVLNFATRPRTIDLSTSGTCAEILLRTDGSRGGPVDLSAINLAGNAGVVLRLER
jgi:alpha-glucosidase